MVRDIAFYSSLRLGLGGRRREDSIGVALGSALEEWTGGLECVQSGLFLPAPAAVGLARSDLLDELVAAGRSPTPRQRCAHGLVLAEIKNK